MPGPPRTPTHLKLIRGNPGHRALPKGEPKPKAGLTGCPPHLSDDAKAEWNRIADELRDLGLLTRLDRAALAAYCQAWSDWIAAEAMLRQHGSVVRSPVKTVVKKRRDGTEVTETSGGYPMQSPFLAIRNNALELMLKYLTQFGLTPASRTRISVDDVRTTETEADKFFTSAKRSG